MDNKKRLDLIMEALKRIELQVLNITYLIETLLNEQNADFDFSQAQIGEHVFTDN